MTAEGAAFWVATAGYALAALVLAFGSFFNKPRLVDATFLVTIAAFAAHTVSIGVRWTAAGRLPYVHDYENILAGTWFIVAVYLALGIARKELRVAGLLVLPCVLLSLGLALGLDKSVGAVTPAYKSAWLAIHVLFAWAAYSAYTLCAALGAVELLKTRKRGVTPGSLLERTPVVATLQQLTFRAVAFGFFVNGVMIASGAIWAYDLWGSYWRWDPVETWSLLTWLAFGFYMHARLTLGWGGKRLAWLTVFALFGVMMMFWGVQFAPSLFGTQYHLYKDVGTMIQQTRMR